MIAGEAGRHEDRCNCHRKGLARCTHEELRKAFGLSGEVRIIHAAGFKDYQLDSKEQFFLVPIHPKFGKPRNMGRGSISRASRSRIKKPSK